MMARMIETLANLLFALEAIEKDHVAFELHVGDLNRDRGAADEILRLEDRRHPAARDQISQLILIELLANIDLAHQGLRPVPRADVNIRSEP